MATLELIEKDWWVGLQDERRPREFSEAHPDAVSNVEWKGWLGRWKNVVFARRNDIPAFIKETMDTGVNIKVNEGGLSILFTKWPEFKFITHKVESRSWKAKPTMRLESVRSMYGGTKTVHFTSETMNGVPVSVNALTRKHLHQGTAIAVDKFLDGVVAVAMRRGLRVEWWCQHVVGASEKSQSSPRSA